MARTPHQRIADDDRTACNSGEPETTRGPIAGHRAFFTERLDIEVDGVEQERGPETQWSGTRWIERARTAA